MKNLRPVVFGRKRTDHVSHYLRTVLDYKLVRMTYDWLPYGGTLVQKDAQTMAVYGGSDCTLPFFGACHNVLWGPQAVTGTNARPTDRDDRFGTSYETLPGNYGYYMASLAPFYETFELFNPSTAGVYVSIPYKVSWMPGHIPDDAADLASQFANQMGRQVEQVQVSAAGTPALRTMLYRGGVLSEQGLIQTYGLPAVEPISIVYQRTFRVKRTNWRWYLPPGGSCKFRVRRPGLKKMYYSDLARVGDWRYGDFALVILAKPDVSFVGSAIVTNSDTSIMLQQGLGVRRTSTSRSTLYHYVAGRVGFQTNQSRCDSAIAEGAVTYPSIPLGGLTAATSAD